MTLRLKIPFPGRFASRAVLLPAFFPRIFTP
jgi:hypothetical protein